MSRQSEKQVRELCKKVISTEQTSPDFWPVANELKTAIHEHCEALREKVVELAVVEQISKLPRAA